MPSHHAIDWNTGTKSAMISIETHSLYLSTSGQDRKPGEPAVLLMQGMGSLIDEWVAVRRLVTRFARWIEYDRSGLGKSETPEHDKVEESEARGFQADLPVLAAKKQFEEQASGHRPVSVVRGNSPRDFQMMYDAGVAAGNGAEEERRLAKEYIGSWDPKDHRWQEETLRLSTFGRMVRVGTSGHNVQMVEPEVIAKEIRWVCEQVI